MSRQFTEEELQEIADALRTELGPVMAALGKPVMEPEAYGRMMNTSSPAERMRLRKALDAAHESRR